MGLHDHDQVNNWGNPFSLAYVYKAMVPVEIGAGLLWSKNHNPEQNQTIQRRELDFIEEKQYDS